MGNNTKEEELTKKSIRGKEEEEELSRLCRLLSPPCRHAQVRAPQGGRPSVLLHPDRLHHEGQGVVNDGSGEAGTLGGGNCHCGAPCLPRTCPVSGRNQDPL